MDGTPYAPDTTTGAASSGPRVEPGVRETETAAGKKLPSLLYFFWPAREDAAGQACEELAARVFVDGRVVDLASNFVCIRVNGKTCPKPVLGKFGVKTFPTIVFMTCGLKVVSSVTTVSIPATDFASLMQSVVNANKKTVEAIEARRAVLESQLAVGDKAFDAGQYGSAKKAYERIVATGGDDTLVGNAKSRIEEIRLIGILEEATKLFDEGKYAEARGRFTVIVDFDFGCPTREKARAMLPECEMGVVYADACSKSGLAALEALGKIVENEDYKGAFKAKAEGKIAEIKASWGKSGSSH